MSEISSLSSNIVLQKVQLKFNSPFKLSSARVPSQWPLVPSVASIYFLIMSCALLSGRPCILMTTGQVKAPIMTLFKVYDLE